MSMRTYYPWRSLNVGDSFEVTNEKGIKYLRQLVYAANRTKSNAGAKFRYDSYVNENGEKVFRVIRFR